MPTQILFARNSTQNNTTTKAHDSPIFSPDRDGIIALAILGAILAFFVGLVLRDLVGKRRSGEFKEDKKSCGQFFRTLFRLPCLMCSKDNLKQLWFKFTNLFRSKANQRVVKKADQGGIELDERLATGKPIGVFNGASSPKPAFGSEITKKSSFKGKAINTTVFPRVAGQGFASTPVRGASSGSIRHGSSEHDNALGISNPGDLYTENAGSGSTNHHQGGGSSSASAGRSHWWSSGHGHGHGTSYSHSHSHSNSQSHDYGSHYYDFGHTDSGGFDSGGFDGCSGGGD
ncbi:hypothetical protein FAGAP_3171 [Fusarium agapanthi]|uniref:Uncharacterized protein n=1 Tax=Fusarium agapanthi TaxID=1803897 RepID=A0A9P5EGT9_9HYPO|nr:hypothetical protein FAGAP_3171 [Fusarium agapanthi]